MCLLYGISWLCHCHTEPDIALTIRHFGYVCYLFRVHNSKFVVLFIRFLAFSACRVTQLMRLMTRTRANIWRIDVLIGDQCVHCYPLWCVPGVTFVIFANKNGKHLPIRTTRDKRSISYGFLFFHSYFNMKDRSSIASCEYNKTSEDTPNSLSMPRAIHLREQCVFNE